MKEITDLVAFLYSKFLLRDIMGKVVPGGILLGTLGGLLGGVNLRELGDYVFLLKGRHLIMLFPLAWVAGFAAQSLGQWLRFLWPPEREEHARMLEILRLDRKDHRAEDERQERFNVILEATGNSAMAVIVFTIVFWQSLSWSGAIALFCVGMLLLREHWITVDRYRDWQDRILKRNASSVLPCWLRCLIRGWNP